MAIARRTDEGSTEKLGYLGLGMMGFPMTQRLVAAGHDVTVWNRSSGKAAALIEAGAKLLGSGGSGSGLHGQRRGNFSAMVDSASKIRGRNRAAPKRPPVPS